MATTKSPYVLRVSSKYPKIRAVAALKMRIRNLLVAAVLDARVQRAPDYSTFDMSDDYRAAIPALIRVFQSKGYDVTWAAYPRDCAVAWLEHSPSRRIWEAVFDKDDALPGRRTTVLPSPTDEDEIQALASIAQDLAKSSDSLAHLHEAQALIEKLLSLDDETDVTVE